jgi:hypothetical protein
MLRSTTSPPPERGGPWEGQLARKRSRQGRMTSHAPMLAACFAAPAGGAPVRVRTFAVDGRRQSNSRVNPQEVCSDADAVRSVPRV